jgi:transcriptional regulator with XRE-family HTH domain
MPGRKEQVGLRIAAGMKAKGIAGPAELCRLVLKHLEVLGREVAHGEPKLKQTLTAQAVSNWINGKVMPSWEMLPSLAKVLDLQEEEILFGSKRGDQLKRERQFLSRITEEEAALLTAFREANKIGQKSIVKMARTLAEDHPVEDASVHQLRRKEDRVKS